MTSLKGIKDRHIESILSDVALSALSVFLGGQEEEEEEDLRDNPDAWLLVKADIYPVRLQVSQITLTRDSAVLLLKIIVSTAV